jgi:hypothetical protein
MCLRCLLPFLFLTFYLIGMEELCEIVNHQNDIKPFVFNISSSIGSGANPRTCIIGGYNLFYATLNYGSDLKITINNQISTTTYAQFLASVSQKPFIIDHIRLYTSNVNQRNQTVGFNYTDANGRAAQDNVQFAQFIEPYSPQIRLVDISYPIKFDENTYLSLPVFQGVSVVVAITPKSIIDLSQNLKF